MASFSKAMIIGNLGRDPEMRYTPNGRPVTEFSVAVNQSTKNQQTGRVGRGDRLVPRHRLGRSCRAHRGELRKGNRVFVEGRFRTREYEARDGQKRISLEITADNVVSLEARARDEEGSFNAPSGGFGGGGGERRPGWPAAPVARAATPCARPGRRPPTTTSTTSPSNEHFLQET